MTPIRLSVCAIVVAGLAPMGFGVPVLTNGSLTGPVGAGIVPPGWAPASGTPDTCDASGPFNYGLPWVLSPDGGTFVRGGSNGVSTFETMSQVIGGFDVGVTYQIDFFQTNLGFVNAGVMTGAVGNWEFGIDGVVFDTSVPVVRPATISDLNVWTPDSVTFVATVPSHTLTVGAALISGGTAAYMGIDGIRITEVPAPGMIGVLGLSGVAALRRRRR